MEPVFNFQGCALPSVTAFPARVPLPFALGRTAGR
jgi:hypothetical protein